MRNAQCCWCTKNDMDTRICRKPKLIFVRSHVHRHNCTVVTDHGWILHLFQLDTLGRRQNNHPTNNAEQLANDKSKEYHIIKEYIINLKGKDIFSVRASGGTQFLIIRTYSPFESFNFFHLHKQ